MLAASDWSWQTFFSNTDAVAIVCGTVMVFLVVVVPVGIVYWYRLAKARAEAHLKQAMVERGMSADEIERVLQAQSPDK